MAHTVREDLLAELADAPEGSTDWVTLQAEAPDLAAEVEIARKVRLLLDAFREAEIAVPEGFEVRLMARLREDRTLIDLVDLWLSGIGRTLLELISLLFAFVPQPVAQTSGLPA